MARELRRVENRIDSTQPFVQEPRQVHQREFPLISRRYSLQDSRSSYKQLVEDSPSTQNSREQTVHRWTITNSTIADRTLTQNPRQHELVHGITSRPIVNGMPLEKDLRMQDHGSQITSSRRASRKLQKQKVPYLSQSRNKGLPDTPQPSQYYGKATSPHQRTLSGDSDGSSLRTGLEIETVEQRLQSYSKETQSAVEFIPEAKKSTIWGAILFLFRTALSQYGESQVDSVPAEKPDDIIATYPRGIRLFLILLSGALPYVVVSIIPDLSLFPSTQNLTKKIQVVLDDTVVGISIPIKGSASPGPLLVADNLQQS